MPTEVVQVVQVELVEMSGVLIDSMSCFGTVMVAMVAQRAMQVLVWAHIIQMLPQALASYRLTEAAAAGVAMAPAAATGGVYTVLLVARAMSGLMAPTVAEQAAPQ
jgi:hypothetical protein